MAMVLLLAVCFLAYANGANDNFKGVASLFGSNTCSYRTALGWATVCTFAGSIAAIFLAQALLLQFSGKGLAPEALIGTEHFLLSVALGAGITVILATRIGLPISTPHALTGALLGSAWAGVGAQLNLNILGQMFFLPLLLSPLLAVALGGALYLLFRWSRLRLGISKEWCICVGHEQRVMSMPQPISVLAVQAEAPVMSVCVDEQRRCTQRYAGHFAGINCQQLMDAAHFLSAGVVCFARGLNDTPKIAALLLVLPILGAQVNLLLVAAAMALGGLLSARRVAETMSHKITAMNHGQGFSANLTTSLLVTTASLFGLPVSTTHVSCGALFGIGLISRQLDFSVVRNIVFSWVLTLPFAAVIGALVYSIV